MNKESEGGTAPLPVSDYLPISTIEKYTFCPRQAYLHYREREDAENALITQGRILHRRVTEERGERRGSLRISRSYRLVSHLLGITGIGDVVETRGGTHHPVEYKHGRGKGRTVQHIQLGLQALCLEEMTGTAVPRGAIYHAGSRKREPVPIDAALRAQCREIVEEARSVLAADRAPPARPFSGCRSCSLRDICLPGSAARSARQYLTETLEELA